MAFCDVSNDSGYDDEEMEIDQKLYSVYETDECKLVTEIFSPHKIVVEIGECYRICTGIKLDVPSDTYGIISAPITLLLNGFDAYGVVKERTGGRVDAFVTAHHKQIIIEQGELLFSIKYKKI